MKICFVISNLRGGGAERVISVLSSHFADFYDTSLVYFEQEKPFYELNPKINLISLKTPKNRILKILYKIFKIRKISAKHDIIISFMDTTNILVLFSCAFLGKKIFISEHSSYDAIGFKLGLLRRIFYPFSNGLSVLSKQDFEYFTFVKNKAIIYNPFAFYKEFSEQENFNKENLIIFVGRLEDIKGCDIFLNALKIADLKDFRVEILGDGSQKNELESLAKNLNINVKFLGSIKEIQNFYKRAKIIVSSSKSEGLPNVLIESIFYKCLRVATPTNGAKELINDGVDGFLSKDFSPNELAKSIQKAINCDEKISQNAYKNIANFKLENIYQKWLDLIKKG
ncbi:MAG: glycosyltransferase, family 1 [Candidatus Campylobacter infans]|nr:MAG: glycosyltransferase, family 1 [Candidatus Campylobacter infans]